MSLDWLTNIFTTLPGCGDGLFKGLWIDGRLKYGHPTPHQHDNIDEYSARLVCATVSRRERLLLVLPDFQPRRAALLFATALIRCWRNIELHVPADQRRVLYFGTTVGIREQLSNVRIQGFNFNLSEIFQQHDLGRGSTAQVASRSNEGASVEALPRVITAYSPADPVLTLRQHNPHCIAIDLDEAPRADWLSPLLEEAARRQIPVIAWGLNPLSECVAAFNEHGQVFVWTPHICQGTTATDIETSVLCPTAATHLQPYVLEDGGVDQLANVLKNANQLLVGSARRPSGPFGKDALRQHWGYLRTLESLSVPYEFYEAEAAQFWGIKTFSQLRGGCERFKDACYQTYPQLALELEKVFATCEQGAELIRQNESPMWNALCNLCIDEPLDTEARLIVFSGQGKKQLFLLALLAYCNISELDLQSVRTWVLTLDELRRLMRARSTRAQLSEDVESRDVDQSLDWRPLLIGLPSPQLTPKLLPALLHSSLDVIIYPHQIAALKHRADEWGKAISPDPEQLSQVLNKLSEQPTPRPTLRGSPRLKFGSPLSLNANTAERKERARVERLWQPDDPVTEVAKLLKEDEDTLDDAQIFYETDQDEAVSSGETWCDKAVKVHFTNGSSVVYPFDETINVVRPGQSRVDERYVSSLRRGDRVLLIHGQRRQSFYVLIISRVHQHPSMMLHLALIQRWQSDFVTAYQRWHERGARNLDELLRHLNDKGSSITSTAALRSWLQGQILCPQDGEDLRRLADVLGMDYVRQQYRRIERAASRLRGLHRGLSNKLNRWLEQQAAGIDAGNDDEVVDPELGLTFGDLRSSLVLLHVKDAENMQGPFLRSSLGKLEN